MERKNITLMAGSAVIEYVNGLEDRVESLVKEVTKLEAAAKKDKAATKKDTEEGDKG